MMCLKRTGLLITLLTLSACGEDPSWVGSYSAQGVWNISGPLAGDRTVGDAVADLLLEDLVGAVGAPSFVQDEVEDYLGSIIRTDLKAAVDASVPPALAPDGALTKALAAALAEVTVESIIELQGDEDELEGKETVTALEYVIGNQRYRITAGELCDESIMASWSGEQVSSDTLSFATHSVEIRYGKLVQLVAEDLLQTPELTGLDLNLSAFLSCPTLVEAMLKGGSGLNISVVGWDHTISSSDLEGYCEAVMTLVVERALGQFAIDSRVEVGGQVYWSQPESGAAIELVSADSFGGIVNILPGSLAPKVSVSFTAAQQ